MLGTIGASVYVGKHHQLMAGGCSYFHIHAQLRALHSIAQPVHPVGHIHALGFRAVQAREVASVGRHQGGVSGQVFVEAERWGLGYEDEGQALAEAQHHRILEHLFKFKQHYCYSHVGLDFKGIAVSNSTSTAIKNHINQSRADHFDLKASGLDTTRSLSQTFNFGLMDHLKSVISNKPFCCTLK